MQKLKQLAGWLAAAGSGGMIAKGPIALATIAISLSALIFLYAVLIEQGRSRKYILMLMFVALLLLAGINCVVTQRESVSPISGTITFHEMGNDYWDGIDGSKNLSEKPILRRTFPHDGQKSIYFYPAIKHEGGSAELFSVLTLHVDKRFNKCGEVSANWTTEDNDPDDMLLEHRYRLDYVKSGSLWRTPYRFCLNMEAPNETTIIYELEGNDNQGRKVKRDRLEVRVVLD